MKMKKSKPAPSTASKQRQAVPALAIGELRKQAAAGASFVPATCRRIYCIP